jgi:anti-sigma factor RsiW
MSDLAIHPTIERLDRWRAGLLDPDTGADVARHVAGCSDCRRQAEVWRTAASRREMHAGLAGRLRARRREVIEGRARPSRTIAAPRLLVGVAAALTLAVGVGVFTQIQGPTQMNGGVEAAGSPNLYAELDFYVWLADQQRNDAGQTGSGAL